MSKKLYSIEIYFGNSLEHEESMYVNDKEELYPIIDELCRDIYEEYAGRNGILDWSEVKQDLIESWGEDEVSNEDVDAAYQDEIDGWMHATITYIPTISYKDIIS